MDGQIDKAIGYLDTAVNELEQFCTDFDIYAAGTHMPRAWMERRLSQIELKVRTAKHMLELEKRSRT